MADAIVVASIKFLLEKTLSLISTDDIGLALGFNRELEMLKRSAKFIQALLLDYENKRIESQAVQLWLKELEGVAYDMDNLLDDLNYEVLRRKVESMRKNWRKVRSLFLFSKYETFFRLRMASKFKDVNTKLRIINQEATGFGLNGVVAPRHTTTTIIGAMTSRQTDSVVPPYVVGREADESKIVEMLLSSPSEKGVSVIPIVGMGGLGKTTLAKSVYNNTDIDSHFNTKIWVCVSEKFEVLELFKLILGSLRRTKVEMSSRDDVVQEIRRELEGKRYLVVFDDVWNEIPELWDNFFDSLMGISTSSGSKCLVTTRLHRVAAIVSRHPPYELGKLSDDDCWSIIKQKVIESGEIPEELNGIRGRVTKRCNGLPLAANVIGGLLRMQRKEEWLSIVEKQLLGTVEDNESSIMQILKLSFDYLPSPSIKKCFAYFSLFEKDRKLDGDLMIKYWMAEGFLQPDLQNEVLMEEIGSKILNVLLQSSLLEKIPVDKQYYQGYDFIHDHQYYKMHDLVHDLVLSISKHESINSEDDGININNDQVRFLELTSTAKGKMFNNGSALVLLDNSNMWNQMTPKFKFKRLRILVLYNVVMGSPSSVGELKQLRFLSITAGQIESQLLRSICKLYNLQTLELSVSSLKDLPQEMKELINLRHLCLNTFRVQEMKMPLEMGCLTCLQTLEIYCVGEEKGRQIEEIGFLKNLKGRLRICNLEFVKDKESAEGAKVNEKSYLTDLEFEWGWNNPQGAEMMNGVLEGLKPPQNVKKLTITNFMGNRLPQWQWLTNLLSLVELRFENCNECIELPMLGHLPCLVKLYIGMKNLRCIGTSFYGIDNCSASPSRKKLFPALKYLDLACMNLIEWTEAEIESDAFSALEELKIDSGYQLRSVPTHFPSLKRLLIYGNIQVLIVKRILNKVVPSSLESLEFEGLDELTSLCGDVGLFACYTCLGVLSLSSCENLMELPKDLYQLQSLRELWIIGCSKIEQIGPSSITNNHLTSLQFFWVNGCDGLTGIASETFQYCASLIQLTVIGCPNLISFPLDLRQTPSLSDITLYQCPKLFGNKDGLPSGFTHLTRLNNLGLGPFSNDDCATEWVHSSGLLSCSSTIYRLRLFGGIAPQVFQHLTSLIDLELIGLENIEALPDWLGSLASLQRLRLRNCEKICYLPSKSAMRGLTKLTDIRIDGCPLLAERCKHRSGSRNINSELSKISHLPQLRIQII